MAEYVYVLSHYGEYGLEAPITATTDRSKVVEIFKRVYPHLVEKCLPNLNDILSQPDEELCCHARDKSEHPPWWNSDEPYWEDGQHQIEDGWGTVQLMVLRLE
jgi:hypothetical protein